MKTLGIIGYGAFGSFAARWLKEDFQLSVYDSNEEKVPENYRAPLAEVCSSGFVVLAIPLSSYEAVLAQISSLLPEGTVVVDVSSVKVKPVELIKRTLPSQPYIALHPLFGPETAGDSIENHIVVVCGSKDVDVSKVIEYLEAKRLEIVEMSLEEHDREMAVVQGLTFFLARGLNEFGVHRMKLKTPSFAKILSLVELDKHHSDDLLDTILNGNKFAREVREDFMQSIEYFNDQLN